ncbi:MAG: class I SAM-dependent methyltransferase [Chloroflexi bacterium]|nr:class I SAM-dependent methyltransferase [Chloroflexota bacterium]
MSTESDHGPMHSSVERLLRPERMEVLDPFRILSRCPVNPRDTVADVGCGPGFFTLPLAKFLINGKVFALDTSDEMIEACQSRLDEARMGNTEVMKCGEYEFPVAPATVDGLFIAFVVHHPSDRVRFLTAAKEMLKPRGWCFILEWQKKETESGPPQEVRITPDELRQIAEDSGFRVQSSRDINDEHHMMILINR